MSWRIVVVKTSSKLDFKMDYMVIRQSDDIKKIHLSEISVLIVESTAVSITAVLLCELVKRKIKVIFCDEKHSPISEVSLLYGSHDTSDKIRKQILWKDEIKKAVWTEIVKEKIKNQSLILKKYSLIKEYEMLKSYIENIEFGDTSNREGHAAKVYFNSLFTFEFTRNSDEPINHCLDYGYTILLSAFNREITSKGYLTQLGIFHNNMFNQFNLSSDLMEPFRTIIDDTVKTLDPQKLKNEEKAILVNLLNKEVIINGKKNYLINAIKIYCASIFNALETGNLSQIWFIENEL